MSLNAPYEDDNVFAKILRGELPCTKVYEDSESLSFMDLFPQSRGHCLVIAKAPSVNLLDADEGTLEVIVHRVQKVARAVKKAFSPDGIRIAQFNGAPAGQTVFHLHFHIVPVYEGKSMAGHGSGQASPEELEEAASLIRAAL